MSPSTVTKGLGATVQQKRQHLGLSLRQAALQIGVSPATLMRIENSDQDPHTDTLRALAAWLGDPELAETQAEPVVEAHLRAQRNLASPVAEALANMFKAAHAMRWPEQQINIEELSYRSPVRINISASPLSGYIRQIEYLAKSIRKMFFVSDELQRFDPKGLATSLGLIVVSPKDIEGLSDDDLHLLLEVYSDRWSGGTITLRDGRRIVILNPTHNQARTAATLMEEICHVLFDHQPTSISAFRSAGHSFRDYNSDQEKEAYWVGAAILVPYEPLARMVSEGIPSSDIAVQYGVSDELVKFRIKVTGLWPLYVGRGFQ